MGNDGIVTGQTVGPARAPSPYPSRPRVRINGVDFLLAPDKGEVAEWFWRQKSLETVVITMSHLGSPLLCPGADLANGLISFKARSDADFTPELVYWEPDLPD